MTDDSDSGDRSTPGGGPTRVVSETSVDDILESIGSSSEGEQTTSDGETERAEENREATDREEANQEATSREQTTESDESDESSDRSLDSDDDDAFDAESIGDSSPTTTTIETGQPADPNAVTGDADSVGAADDPAPAETAESEGSATREDDHADLAARIERGAVTGADVRAAESGDDREETTDIGEIDLSMDDLESPSGSAGSSGQKGGRSSTDGPLSGSVGSGEADSDDDSTEADESEDSESDSSGVFGRLKGLFSR